jgi:hypothetical protein
VTLVDEADAESVVAYRWRLSPYGYAQRSFKRGAVKTYQSLHRQLLGLAFGDGLEVDHINGDRLDNRRENLRIVTKAEQAQNAQRHGRRIARGVCFHRGNRKWMAYGYSAGRIVHLGYFTDVEEAGRVATAWRSQHMPLFVDRRG